MFLKHLYLIVLKKSKVKQIFYISSIKFLKQILNSFFHSFIYIWMQWNGF